MRIRVLRGFFLLLVSVGGLSACAESSVTPPAAPSALPAEKVGRLDLSCPAGVEAHSLDGRSVSVAFDAPAPEGGQGPVSTQCTPASGSSFDIGTTTVSCTASDALQQSARCSFPVTIIPPPLELSCPAPVQAQTLDGRPVVVTFDPPRTGGGHEPITTQCTPASGSTFEIGITTVECTASDASNQSARCSFPVTVLGPPMLAVTDFLAFGDSLTASAYPGSLERNLTARYRVQDIRVVNAGVPGEQASDGVVRFRTELLRQRPDVVLLMEGTNDLSLATGAGAESAAEAIESMVQAALGAGADTLLMTVPPQRNRAEVSLVEGYNRRIRAIAARRGVVLVDIHDLLLHGRCGGTGPIPCIGPDGLHPTPAGYQLIVEELERVIVDRYDVEIRAFAHAAPGPSYQPRQHRASPLRARPGRVRPW